ncbi:acetyl esterase/lipase [Arcticibacter tournemirensis]|uniref:Alpha/beta hydrolase n=1 Tax=Arcticibacter tournemirensis TaxID=699437 RepID=A0A5M9H9H3_9SPHI|nr:alpha/beta hydrolase [Arcticibacter tournemirensis]KAA8483566.1 alpha/beta hydrolase [Arcticibacter tournemirensis]TQM51484.1 acetyl esterase/lipase [Arcticibacter tournemirensis]
MYKIILTLFCTLILMKGSTQTVIALYNGEIPGSIKGNEKEEKNTDASGMIRYGKVSEPTLEIHLPPAGKANGAAVVIVPGGGYHIVSYTNEGTDIAAEFNKMGVAAFILKYRLPSDAIMKDKTTGPLQDAQQALKVVRSRAKEWSVDINKVGIIGFSAGGHLASTAGTHFNKSYTENKEKTNLRPDFMILVYPVISLRDSLMHKGSRDNLLGTNPSASLITEFSNELQITPQTPPTMLIHSADDKTVKIANSLVFYENLLKNNVSAEMHLYPKGGHGFGIRPNRSPDHWTDRVEHWLKGLGMIK